MFRFSYPGSRVGSRMCSRLRSWSSVLLLMCAVCVAAGPRLHAQGSRLTVQQLGDALTDYGKNTVTSNGQTYYSINCGHGNWKSNLIVSLSPNGSVIWMTIDPIKISDRASSAALASLLKKNTDIGPTFFSINGEWLRISSPVPNVDMNKEKVKAYVVDIVNTAVDTMPLWQSLGGS